MSDDEAVIAMVDANIQREELLPSEKAFAFKMKLEAMKKQGARSDLTSCQNGTRFRADESIAEQTGGSARSVQRYIRLTELIPELLDYVDKKKLQFSNGSYNAVYTINFYVVSIKLYAVHIFISYFNIKIE